MGFWRGVLRLLTMPTATFSESEPRPIDRVILDMMGGGSVPSVGRLEALSVPAVQRGRNLICSISTLPLVQYGPDRTVVPSPLLDQLDTDIANVVTLAMTVEDLLFDGVSWWQITEFGWDGYPVKVRHLDPRTVSLTPPSGRSPSPLPAGYDPREAVVYVDGVTVPASRMIRFDSPNPAVLKVGGRAIRRAILLDKLAAMYADDPRPLDYFTPAEGADPADDADVQNVLDDWKTARKRRSTAYVPAALKYNSVSSPSPSELQLAELQKQAGLDIANALGVDPEELGISTTSRTYANATDRRKDRINDVLSPYMRAITDRLSMGDVTKRGYRVAFDLDDYMKPDPLTRASVYRSYLDMGVLTVDQIAAEENLPAPTAPAPEPAAQQVDAATQPTATFDNRPMTFADLPLETFEVDTEKRTITGLALPYGKSGNGFRFEKGALQFGDPTRIKLLRDHDPKQAIGHAVELTDSNAGFKAKFKVARGEEGNRVLALAEDGVLDGLSVGVDFDPEADTTPDPRNKTGTLVRRADLREVSLTAMPAFDDARVSKVAASRTQGETVPETTTEPTLAPAAPAVVPGTYTAADVATLLTALQAQPVPEQRQTVNPVRMTASIVNEELPYRFDRQGNLTRGSRYDFSTDMINGIKGDAEALVRAETFMRAQFDTDMADAATLNPNRNRPDLYVDQKEFEYPIWNAINKGTLADQTPFVLPKFNTSSGMVAAHVEGTEPTAGVFTATSQTITPSAVSGKVSITREAWDQGGNPQLSSIVWRQMERAWYEALEASAVTMLDALTPTGITITALAADAALEASLTSQLAPLQYIRGGFRMRDFFVQVDLYKAMIAAKDTAGRKLFPVIGAQNATGTTAEFFSSVLVAGLVGRPAWALAATGSVPASSYLFDRNDVSGWATAPQRLQFDNVEVRYVHIGLWGYKALACTDVTGVREVIYDPA